jgi:hypothetical protein
LAAKSTDLEAVNEAFRSLSLGSIALTRLIAVHEANSALSLPDVLLGINYYDEKYASENYEDPSLEEIAIKLKELGA